MWLSSALFQLKRKYWIFDTFHWNTNAVLNYKTLFFYNSLSWHYLATKLFIIKFCISIPFFVQLLQECRAFLKTSLDQDNYILYCCPNGEAGYLCPCSTTIDKKCPYCWFLRLELEGIIERWQICNANPSKWREIQKGIDCLISDSNESDSDQGNLLRGIVIWLVAARSVVERTVSPSFSQPVLVKFFLYFKLKQKTLFTNNFGHIWFPFT